jgi:hypothetical protein
LLALAAFSIGMSATSPPSSRASAFVIRLGTVRSALGRCPALSGNTVIGLLHATLDPNSTAAIVMGLSALDMVETANCNRYTCV